MHYAVVFETESDSTEVGPPGAAGESGTDLALKDIVLKVLRETPPLLLDIRTLIFEPTTLNHLQDLLKDKPGHLSGVISQEAAVAISEMTTESINNSEDEAAPNESQGTDKETLASTFPTQETCKHFSTVTALVTVTESSPPEASGGTKLKEAEEQNLIIDAEGNVLFLSKISYKTTCRIQQTVSVSNQSNSLFISFI